MLKERPCRNKSQSFCPVDRANVPVSHSILSISANLKTSGVHAYGTVHHLPILINPQSWLWLKLTIHDAFTFHCSLSVSNASLISVELQLCRAFLHCRQFLDLESWRTSSKARLILDAMILKGHRTLSVSQVLLTNKMDHMIPFQEAAFVHPGCSFNWFTTSRRYRKLKKPLHYGGSQRNESVSLSVLYVQLSFPL